LTPSVIPDVIAFRVRSGAGFDDEMPPRTLSSQGEACATASDRPACLTAFAALRPSVGFGQRCVQLCNEYHLAVSSGDTVRAVSTIDQLREFLAPIDTPQEAMLIAFANGYDINCMSLTEGGAKPTAGGWEVLAQQGIACGAGTAITRHYLTVATNGVLTEQRQEVVKRGDPGCAVGRRPMGFVVGEENRCSQALGRYFSEMAHLEAASVPAFEQMHAVLVEIGAPLELRTRALLAALDEIDHTRRTTDLALRFGASVAVPSMPEPVFPTRLAFARDNIIEGCVRETFGALSAHYQAHHAKDPDIRNTMTVIAEDETRHAELAWAIAEWLSPQLSALERESVDEARHHAVETLRRELQAPSDDDLTEYAGLPSPEMASRLLEALVEEMPLSTSGGPT
jgi:uncharacterized protein YqiB (DUF1249 family)